MSLESMSGASFHNVRACGASGAKSQDARPFIQRAVNACSQGGGGVVYFPPGQYTSSTIHLRSRVRVFLESGATVYSSKDREAFDRHALFFGENLENVTLEGRGTVDGQAEYEWRPTDHRDWYIYPNEVRWREAGLSMMRPFPTKSSYGNLVLLVRCRDVRISGLDFVRSPSWVIHPWQCDHLVIDGIRIRTSRKEGVWADGIDPDGCSDVRIANCTIDAGDDALVFYSSDVFGPPRPCENVTVTNCRLSSASSALKFCDGNLTAIRNVTIDNCVITDSNRGIAFMSHDGGCVENVVVSNVVVDCRRYEWFWWGDGDPIHFNLIQRHEMVPDMDPAKSRPVGAIRNVMLSNIVARGVGACLIHGHPASPLENVSLENIRLTVGADTGSPLQKSGNALTVENARNLRLRDVEIAWEEPCSPQWRSAISMSRVDGLTWERVHAPRAPNGSGEPAVVRDGSVLMRGG
jgi:hypothetical protein